VLPQSWPTGRTGSEWPSADNSPIKVIFSEQENILFSSFQVWQSNGVRFIVAMAAASLGASVLAAPPSSAGPTFCDYPACTPGIMPHQVLGAPCDNTTYYVFGVDEGVVPPGSQPGRLMFCGSPRRYQPRWFRSPPMAGIKDEGAQCQNFQNYVAQAPDGLFLICYAHEDVMTWIRADT
jgi:hypothetical protein